MCGGDLKFVIFRDMKDGGGYRWRLSSAAGETVGRSEGGHPNKGEANRRCIASKRIATPMRGG